MNRLVSFLKLIRLPNLIIIGLAQYAMRYGVIYPMYLFINKQLILNFPNKITNPSIIELQVSNLHFFCLCLSTLLIAAGGYIINDYFDINIDRINKPQQLIIDNGIKRRSAMALHLALNLIALLLAGIVLFKMGFLKYILIYIACSFGLWYYTTEFKKAFLIGNIIIAIFVAMVPFTVGLFELQLAASKYAVLTNPPFYVNFKKIFHFILGFSALSFLINFIREIIKDIEDIDGDLAYGCETLPITLGFEITKNILITLIGFMIAIMGFIQRGQWDAGAFLSFWYILLLIQLPLLLVGYLIWTGKNPSKFKWPDLITKGIMLTGIAYVIVIYLGFTN